jgi:uncharacterized protein (DUF2236 family)
MSILRVTTFRWGGSINNWYPDWDAVQRQLIAEFGRIKSKDVTHEEWYECTSVPAPTPIVKVVEEHYD